VDISSSWETIRENIKISAEESLGHYEVRNKSCGSTRDAQNHYVKRGELNCSGYKIQVKTWG
jgi:hypothetical protein